MTLPHLEVFRQVTAPTTLTVKAVEDLLGTICFDQLIKKVNPTVPRGLCTSRVLSPQSAVILFRRMALMFS